jgi:Family of unknown function (DUF6365)
MRVLFLAPSRLSRGDASIAADLARSLPRSRFQVGFVAAAEAVSQLHDLGLPTLPLTGATSGENLAILDRIMRGFDPECLLLADAFAIHQSRGWSGLTVERLRERYGRPIASIDRLGWGAADYTVDFYGGHRVRLPRLLDGCDLVIQPGPPHRIDAGSPGVTVAALHPGGLRDGGLRSSGHADDRPADDRPADSAVVAGSAGARPMVFLVNSPWEYRNRLRSLPVAQLIDALPRVVHSHLAALGRPLRVIHVGPRHWHFPPAEQIEYQHFSRMPYAMFQARLAAADLFLTTNTLSMTLAQAVLGGVPALVLDNHERLGPDRMPDWVAACAPLLQTAYPFRVAPLGWHDALAPLLSGNPYQRCFATAGLFDRPAVLAALTELLYDQPARADLRRRQGDYRERLAGLPPVDAALRAVVTR